MRAGKNPGPQAEEHPSKPLDEAVEKLPADQKDYIKDRFDQYRDWYDNKAVGTKGRYLKMRTATVVGGAVVPVLVNVPWHYIKLTTTIISLIVVILVSLESVYHYREQWKNYRSTEQFLVHEKVCFLKKIGIYAKSSSEADAFKLFVNRVETAIASENATTLNTMTLANEAASKGT